MIGSSRRVSWRLAAAGLSTPVVISLVVVSGCGSASSTPTGPSSVSASTTVAAPATGSPVLAGSAATPSMAAGPVADPVVAGASTAFSKLTSYQFDVTMTGGSYAAALAPHGMQGTVAYDPSFAVEFSYADLEVIAIEGKNWTKNGTSWDLSPYPGNPTTFDSFGPPVLFAHDFAPFVPYYSKVGDEVVNNVSATHYTCNPHALGWLSGTYGFAGNATVAADVWIAKDGGYPVRFEVTASGTAQFDLKVDITKANDPANVVDVPAS